MMMAASYLFFAWTGCLDHEVDPALVTICTLVTLHPGTATATPTSWMVGLGCDLLLLMDEYIPVCQAQSMMFGIFSMVFILITLKRIKQGTD